MSETVTIEEPRFARLLFNSRQGALIWLVVRMWLGYQWLHAGWEKVTGTSGGTFAWHFGYTNESWLRSSAGLKGFAAYAIKGAGTDHAAVNYGWYAHFLHYLSTGGGWMAPVIAIGETAIGIALILGLFTGVAAFCGGLLNMSFGLAGVAGVGLRPQEQQAPARRLDLDRRGLDRYALPMLGTPWHRGKLFDHATGQAAIA